MGIAQACPVGFFETICFSTLHLVAMKNVFRRKEPVEVPVNSLVNKLEAVEKTHKHFFFTRTRAPGNFFPNIYVNESNRLVDLRRKSC